MPDDGSTPAAYIFNDGVNISFRFRLDADPTGTGGQGLLESFGWGFEIDTDQNADDYEWLMMLDGISSPEVIRLMENTVKSHLGDPSDKAEDVISPYPLAGNYRISTADTCFDSQNNVGGVCNVDHDYQDYFLDYKIPYAVFKAATSITDTTLIRFFVGSSSAANNLTERGADLVAGSDLYEMASDYVTPFGYLPSNLTFYSGTVRFVTDLNGAYDSEVVAPGDPLYIRVDDLDLNSQTNPGDTLTVTVTSPTGDSERVILYATGVQGKYTGSLPTSGTANSDDTLYILSGQTAAVTYIEAVAADLSQNVARIDTIYFTSNGTDIAITKSVNDPAPAEGDTVNFTITATNNGPSTVTALTITDLLPTGLTYLNHTASQGAYTSGTGSWVITTTLAKGASATLSLNATVDTGTSGQTLTNKASLSTSTPADGYSLNNEAEVSVRIGGTDLRITKSVDDPLPLEGDSLHYTVRVINLGPTSTSGIQVTDLLPTGVSYGSHTVTQGTYTSGNGLWDVGTLAAGNGALLRITATVDSSTAGQTITNVAELTASTQPDTNLANDSANAAVKVEYLDLSLTKEVRRYTPTTSSFADSVAANTGDTVEFRITVANNGPHDASGIEVTDTLPTAGLTYVTSSASATQGSYDPGTGIWSLGDLADKDDATLTFQATVDTGTAGQTLANEAEITDVDQPDSSPGDEYDTAFVSVDGTDLRLVKSVSDQTPSPGDTITWTVTIYNDGPNQATGVEVTDLLPDGLSYVTAQGKPVHTKTQGTFSSDGTWTVGTLNSTANATLTFNTKVDSGTTGKTIVNNAFITAADQSDPDERNNVASEYIAVGGTNLTISKNVDNTTPNVGQTIVYTLIASNNGPADATGVVVVDRLPPEVGYAYHTPSTANYDATTGNWTIGNLANGANATLDITATVLNEDNNLLITNTSTVTANEADQDPSDNTATADIVVNAADLEINKTVDNSSPNEGTLITYTLTVSNASSNSATNVEVEDILPSGLTLVTATPSQGTNAAGLWLVGDIAGNSSASLDITAVVNTGTGGSTITNIAEIIYLDQIDTDASNNLASVDIMPALAPIINLRKTVQTTYDPVNGSLNPYAIPGANIEYTITATNSGAGGTATDSVILSDPIPVNTAMYVGPAGGTTSPVSFSDGSNLTPPQTDSGLSYTFSNLESLADDLEFYDGSSWNYVPSPDTDGYDIQIKAFRVNFGNAINAAGSGNTPTFEIKFRVRVQ